MPAPIKVSTQAIVNALLKWRGNVVAAAGEVGMAANSMYERIEREGIDLAGFRSLANPVTPNTGMKPVTGFRGAQHGAQKSARSIFPPATDGRRLGPVSNAVTEPMDTDVPIKTAPRRPQPIRIKPDQRELLQRAAWELQARFRVATDENLILEQYIEEGFEAWLEAKLSGAAPKTGRKRSP
jgi:hypothetical protein